jgi:hypothetical protein
MFNCLTLLGSVLKTSEALRSDFVRVSAKFLTFIVKFDFKTGEASTGTNSDTAITPPAPMLKDAVAETPLMFKFKVEKVVPELKDPVRQTTLEEPTYKTEQSSMLPERVIRRIFEPRLEGRLLAEISSVFPPMRLSPVFGVT